MGSGLEHLSAEEQEALWATFQTQAADLLAAVQAGLQRLQAAGPDPGVLRGLERAVHTLKGDAGAFGLEALVRVAHRMEDLLEAAAEGRCPLEGAPLQLLLRAADACERLLEAGGAPREDLDLEPLLAALAASAGEGGDRGKDGSGRAGDPGEGMDLTEYDRRAVAEAEGRGLRTFLVQVALDPQCPMVGAGALLLLRHLRALGSVLRSEPPLEGAPLEGCRAFRILLATRGDARAVEAACRLPGIVASAAARPFPEGHAGPEAPPPIPVQESPAPLPGAAAESRPDLQATPPRGPRGGAAAGAAMVLVDSRRIDRAMNLVGELVIARSMVAQALRQIQAQWPKADCSGRLEEGHRLLAHSLAELQKAITQMRLVPIQRVFRRLPRLVRDLAAASGEGKEVRLVLEGEGTELDKGVVDALGEPLGHLVRNAVDHGIEPAAERLPMGKPAAGTVRVAARAEGNQIVIEVADDGRGIDPEALRRAALARGLLTAEAAGRLTEAEALDLIFLPRFSTTTHVTASSGRGIGMDAVRAAVEGLKGQVRVASRVGSGTTVSLRVPLTLAILRALLFRAAGRLFALPLSSIAEIVRTEPGAVRTVDGRQVLPLRGRVIGLHHLADALGLPRHPTPSIIHPGPEGAPRHLYVVVVALADRRLGLVVDALLGERELVLKALDLEGICRAPVAGAALLGDGRVVLMLDPAGLVHLPPGDPPAGTEGSAAGAWLRPPAAAPRGLIGRAA